VIIKSYYRFKPLAESSLEEYRAWENTLVSEPLLILNERHPDLPPRPIPLPVLPARMCTVSHCHKILPGHYKFRRCAEHRKQNRYHSNLKRIREKERKTRGPGAIDGWSAWTPTDIEEANKRKNENENEAGGHLFSQEPQGGDGEPEGDIGKLVGDRGDTSGVDREPTEADVSVFTLYQSANHSIAINHSRHPGQTQQLLQQLEGSDAQITSVQSKRASTFFLLMCRGRCVRLVEHTTG
jgi:hypothetical protein